MVEALSEDLSTEDLMKYTEVCDFAFNFNFVVHLKSPASAEAIEEQILDWLQNLPAGKTANWVVRTCCQFFLCIASKVFERVYLSKLFASKLSIDPMQLLKTGSDKIIYWFGRFYFLLGFVLSKKQERMCSEH